VYLQTKKEKIILQESGLEKLYQMEK
jgi:hypothetical protein